MEHPCSVDHLSTITIRRGFVLPIGLLGTSAGHCGEQDAGLGRLLVRTICLHDILKASAFVKFRDGLLPQDPLLGKYCSTWSPPPLQTTGPYAWVHFHSNNETSDRGFHVTYTTSPGRYICVCTYHVYNYNHLRISAK